MWDQKTGGSRGFSCVSFRNQQDAQTAINELMVRSLLLVARKDDPLIKLERISGYSVLHLMFQMIMLVCGFQKKKILKIGMFRCFGQLNFIVIAKKLQSRIL